MKRVMIVLPQLWTGGIQKMNLELAAHINDPRVEVTILSLYPNSDSIFDKQAKEQGVKVVYLDKKPGVDLSIIWKINRFMKQYKPDVIHINQRMTTYVLLPMLLRRTKKRIYVVHSLADTDSRGITRKINRFAFHHFNLIPVAISETCRASISNVYGIKEGKIPCIYNGVELEKYRRTSPYPSLASSECIFITACAFRKEKNLPLMVEAFAEIHNKNENVRLVMLGDGEMMDIVKQRVNELHIENVVELPGNVYDVSQRLQAAHVYVLASDWEGLPVSVLEAMSAGLPIVATKAGGVVDIVEDGTNGFLTEIGNKDQLANAMLKLATDSELRMKFSKASERLSHNYGMDQCVENYIQLYTSD